MQNLQIQVKGHVKIYDVESGDLVFDKSNSVHAQNMALALSRALARDDHGPIYKLCFGNGGAFTNASGSIVYRTPNVIGGADLYNQTYETVVDEQSAGVSEGSSVTSAAAPSPSIASMVTVLCKIGADEPGGQAIGDNVTSDPGAPFFFNEMGLKTEDGLLLTHLTFSPWEKTAGRAFRVSYSLTLSVS